MTPEEESRAGDGSGAGGVCQPRQREPLWVSGRTIPEQCFTVSLEVHQADGVAVFGLHLEVTNPHTKELLAAWVNPTEVLPAGTTLAGHLSQCLRAILLDLTDPEPF